MILFLAMHYQPKVTEATACIKACVEDVCITIGSGSLTTYDHQLLLLTSGHIARNELPLYACFPNSICLELAEYTAGAQNDPSQDWAIYLVEEDKSLPKPLRLNMTNMTVDQSVMSYGWPLAEFRVVHGTVAEPIDSKLIALEMNVVEGMSGAPVVDKHNHIRCVVTGYQWLDMQDTPVASSHRGYCTVPNFEFSETK